METLTEIWQTWFGAAGDVGLGQIMARVLVVLAYAAILLRMAGEALLRRGTWLDFLLLVIVGSSLAGAAVGSAPLLGTMLATAVLVGLRRLTDAVWRRWRDRPGLSLGHEGHLIRKGRVDWKVMEDYGVSEDDLREAMQRAAVERLDQIESATVDEQGAIRIQGVATL